MLPIWGIKDNIMEDVAFELGLKKKKTQQLKRQDNGANRKTKRLEYR